MVAYGSVLMNYYRNMDRSKIQFDFICDEDSTNIPYDEIEKLGGRVMICPPYQKVFKYQKFLINLFKQNNYKIVHSNINALSVFPLRAAKKAGVPIRIAHSHSTANKKEWKKTLIKNMLRPFSKKYANVYFACSELAGKWLFGNKTYDEGKVTIINNAIDVEKFVYNEDIRKKVRSELNAKFETKLAEKSNTEIMEKTDVEKGKKDEIKLVENIDEQIKNENNMKINDDTLVVGHIGRFVKQKNHEFLIDIFNEIHKRKENSVLILAGQGPLQKEIEEKVKSLGLQDYVLFLGQRSDANELYQAMDVFVLPSLYEGLGMVLIEAQYAGLNCYCSEAVPKEAYISNLLKKITLSDDPSKWAEKIIDGQNEFTRKNMSVELKDSGYDIKKEATKLEEKYFELLNEI